MDNIHIASKVLSDEDYTYIKKHVDSLDFKEPSTVFNVKRMIPEVDREIRHSSTVRVKAPEVLEFIRDKVMGAAGEKIGHKMTLARDHVTFIKYSKGGHFDWHRDFEKYVINKGNGYLEMHLIYCITAPGYGGALYIKPDEKDDCLYDHHFKTNECIVFDKRMPHRATNVQEGEKIIMTVDVLVKQDSASTETVDAAIRSFNNGEMNAFCYYDNSSLENQLKDVEGPYQIFGCLKLEIMDEEWNYLRPCSIYFDHKGAFRYEIADVTWSRSEPDKVSDREDISSIHKQILNGIWQKADSRDLWCDNFLQLLSATGSSENTVLKGLKLIPLPGDTGMGEIDPSALSDSLVPVDGVTSRVVEYNGHCNEEIYETKEYELYYGVMRV